MKFEEYQVCFEQSRAYISSMSVYGWAVLRIQRTLRSVYLLAINFPPGIRFRQVGKECSIARSTAVLNHYQDIRLNVGVILGPRVTLEVVEGARLLIGEHAWLTRDIMISVRDMVEIGAHALIGEYVSIRDSQHVYRDPEQTIDRQGMSASPIRVGRDVWIGRGVYIGPGVTIGDGAVIGANSVVLKDIPSYAVAVGVPARVIKYRS